MESNIILNSQGLREKINETKSWIVWRYSPEDEWNDFVRELYKVCENSFFIGTVNKYNKRCGWYVRFSDLKPILSSIYDKIANQYNYKSVAQMMYKYNHIIEYINSNIQEKHHLPTLKKCNNQYCIFNIEQKCCNLNQDKIEPNSLVCVKTIRADYYELLRVLRDTAKNEIRYMDLNQLVSVIKIGEHN